MDSTDPYSLELFAKNVSDDYSPTFAYTTVNGGYHNIVIKDKLKPSAPTADPLSGSYTDTQSVTLEAEEGCEIFYSTDGGTTYLPYTGPIEVERSTEIRCYAVRSSDGKVSNTVTYTYRIIPKSPSLFIENESGEKELIQNIYSDDQPFTVYASDSETFGPIADDSEIYYTFSQADIDPMDIGDDPEVQWVKLDKRLQSIAINQKRVVRLVTVKQGIDGTEYSDVSWYYLGIRPAAVVATPDSGIYDTKVDVTLTTETENATIYYTIDGSDPRTNGIEYATPLTFNRDTTLRAVALYDGEYSDITSFYYVFNVVDAYGIEAFYPPGVYEGDVSVTLMAQDPDNRIEYSTDGGETWQEYTGTLTLDTDTEILARAIDKDGNVGDEYKFVYTIKPLPPVFAPESTQFTNADEITIYSPETTAENTGRFELYYTIDGSDPITSSTAIKADETSDTAVIKITKYTVVSAVVKKDGTTYSSVVTHSYDIVTTKPVTPITTLPAGSYIKKIGSTEDYTTQFMPVPNGTTIYYTVSYGDEVLADPVPGTEGTIEYDGTPIDIKGNTIIKAVAVNVFGVKSDIGIFGYTVTPETPKAAPSATIHSDTLPVVPVEAVAGSTVSYTIGDVENSFVAPDSEKFYIDTQTGNAYEDADCTIPLGTVSDTTISSPATLDIWAELDGVQSEPNRYIYTLTTNAATIAPPYADKETGTYEEINIDGENNLLLVNLYSLNVDAEIQYRTDNTGAWLTYDGNALKLKEDTMLQVRATKDGNYSTVESYVYEFVPLPPIITLPSGRYSADPVPTTTLELDSRVPTDKTYTIFYRANGDTADVRYTGVEREIDHTMSFKAYVVSSTGKKSANTIHYYIIETASIDGSVYTAYPYEVYPGEIKRISADVLSTTPYNEGIKLLSVNHNADINYFYTYTTTSGDTVTTNTMIYDNAMPIFANSSMENLTITAWLTENGTTIDDSQSTFQYEFVTLGVPTTSLEEAGVTEVSRGTSYTLLDYPADENMLLYYTLDGSDPTDSANENRMIYGEDEVLQVTQNVTVKAVYYSACGKCVYCRDGNIEHCTNAVYGPVGTYRYTIPTRVGGGGGGGGSSKPTTPTTIDNTRRYTKDIFGNEHPTHIGYINGYPDGSVRPDGQITREESAAILYRIKNKEYDAPFATSGDVFPDVSIGRWSVLEIEYMANDGVITGYPDSEFKPENNLTRAEFAALICRFANLETDDVENVFPDLADTHWAYDDVIALYSNGFIDGYEDGTFRPENEITRAEVMKVINKLLGRNPSEDYVKSLNFNPFNDLDENSWHYVTVLEATITHNYYLDDDDVEYQWEDWK